VTVCLAVAMALWSAACFNNYHSADASKGIGFKSFLGVEFGASQRDTERYHPNGIKETSPLGYPCYHITKASSDGIVYPDVIYEFDGVNGMQVVVARFAPSSTDAVLERLRRILGEPTQHTLTKDQFMDDALWMVSDGEEIRFDRSRHLMTVLGPQGHNLSKDLQLRIENSSATL
jgi:hypothetical protein